MSEIDRILEQKLKQLNKDLEEIAYKDLKPFVEDELKKSTTKNIYGAPESEYYDRTGMMFDSITGFARKSENGIDVYAIMDLENTTPHHRSWIESNTTNVDKYLDNWMEYGNNPNNGNPIVEYEGRLMFAEAQYSIDKKGKRLVKSKLKAKGYKVKG